MAELTIDEAITKAKNLQSQGKCQEAEHLYRLILKGKPSHALTNNSLGELLAVKKRFEEAVWHIKKAIEQEPNEEVYAVSLLNLYIKIAEYEKVEFLLSNNLLNISREKKYEYLEIVKKNKKCGLDEKKLLNLYNDGCFGDVINITEKIVQKNPKYLFGLNNNYGLNGLYNFAELNNLNFLNAF
jgi:hypothetical protein